MLPFPIAADPETEKSDAGVFSQCFLGAEKFFSAEIDTGFAG